MADEVLALKPIFIYIKLAIFAQPLASQQCQESALAAFPLGKHNCKILLLDTCTKDVFKADNH